MNRDFTLFKYKQLCKTIIESNYSLFTVRDYIQKPFVSSSIILRHDVDRKIDQALDMASLEQSLGIKATYYFRMRPKVFNPDIIKKIENMGHEIGYHYEVLDKTNGNIELAVRMFKEELNVFREIADVKTACMHGNPYTKWLNRDIWQKYDFRDFGIIGEPYLSIDFNSVLYLSDTGRSWKNSFNLKDTVSSPFREVINSTDEIIKLIVIKKYPAICISTHPNRWNNSPKDWLFELVWQNVKNMGKQGIKLYMTNKMR